MRSTILAVGLTCTLGALAAADSLPPAAKPQARLVRGTITTFDGKQISIKTSTGEDVSAAISPNSRFLAVESRTFAQIKPTDFIGVTAVDGTNGHLRAEEIHIIPAVGVGEGQYPWDHHPDNATGSMRAGSMTNGTVQMAGAKQAGSMTNGTVGTAGANELTMTFRGSEVVNGHCVGHAAPTGGCTGTAIVDVTPSTYIAALVPAKPEDVKAGLAAVAGIGPGPDSKLFLGSVTVEKNGVKPQF
jgi:hypothetical protein